MMGLVVFVVVLTAMRTVSWADRPLSHTVNVFILSGLNITSAAEIPWELSKSISPSLPVHNTEVISGYITSYLGGTSQNYATLAGRRHTKECMTGQITVICGYGTGQKYVLVVPGYR